jgi:phosphatidylglycerol:prolipoprotein diacylglycerol transferase
MSPILLNLPSAVIEIGIDPFIEIGPVTIAWHGLTIALGLLLGGVLATRVARERGLDGEEIFVLVAVIAIAGMIGARGLYLLENEPGDLLTPDGWLGTNGFSFYGGIIAGVPAVAAYLRYRNLGIGYLDPMAAGFPLGMALGRIGDVINGEHYGPPSDLPWAVRNTHPDADVPSSVVAYHSGGLYEVVLALAIFAVVWPLRKRITRTGLLISVVVALYAAGRFAMFFVRSDSDELTLGLAGTQWVSLILLIAALAGAWIAIRSDDRRAAESSLD